MKAPYPLPMEAIDQNYGFALYRTMIPKKFRSSSQELKVPLIGDRGIVFVGKASISFKAISVFEKDQRTFLNSYLQLDEKSNGLVYPIFLR